MIKRKKELTQEQIDYRNSILRKNVSTVKMTKKPEIILTDEDEIRKCFYYLNNCVFWINEYIDGRIDKKRLLEAAKAIQGNGKSIEAILKRIT